MKIQEITIENIAGIKNLKVSFNKNFNVLCGANGIGKTTILDIIADSFSSNIPSKIKRNAMSKSGKYNITIEGSEKVISKEIVEENFAPDEAKYRPGQADTKDLLYFGIDRNIKYRKLDAIKSDPQRTSRETGTMAVSGVSAEDIKNWFVNRYLFEGKEGSLTKEQIDNYHFALSVFSILDKSIHFKTINAQTFDIMLSTPKGDIFLEYLSSGYKSCIYILLGIIKEIEFRYVGSPIKIQDFNGVVLIDEIDLHLHPLWQTKLIEALKKIFPNVQFIVTTHSPSILQILQSDEIIALGHDENGDTILKDLKLGKYGLQGWTLEEILLDVMEIPTTTSKIYQDTLSRFDDAMNNEDREVILEQYDLLKEMLHPQNPLRKLLSIQMVEWEE